MKFLLHVCCADCSLNFLSQIKNYNIDMLFFNPNIHPRSEYLERYKALKEISKKNDTKLIVLDWSPKEYFNEIKYLKDKLNNKDIRCPYCWNLRLKKTAEYAKKNGYEIFSSTLLTSHYQDREKIVQIGERIANNLEIQFYKDIIHNCDLKTGGFYKQNYCGCVYSLLERYQEKYFTP